MRDGKRALELALELYEKVPTPESVETLAMAYAEAGRFTEAVTWQRQLLDKLGPDSDPQTTQRLRLHLELYESGEACCAKPGA